MKDRMNLELSSLGHTWILDLDGTIVKHNGYQIDGHDSFLNGVQSFLHQIPECDMVVFITSRKKEFRDMTVKFLKDNGIRFDYIIFEAPYGERILINDCKVSGLNTSIGIATQRDEWCNLDILINYDK